MRAIWRSEVCVHVFVCGREGGKCACTHKLLMMDARSSVNVAVKVCACVCVRYGSVCGSEVCVCGSQVCV